jgi:hypothetical protein
MAENDHAALRVGRLGLKLNQQAYDLQRIVHALELVGNDKLAATLQAHVDSMNNVSELLSECSGELVAGIVHDAQQSTDNMFGAALAVASLVKRRDESVGDVSGHVEMDSH